MTQINPQMAARLDQMGALAKAKRFLAREFLIWLWHQSEQAEAPASFSCPLTGQHRKFRFWIDDRLTLEATSGRVHLHQMRGGAPAQTPEAAAGILSGQTIRDLRIGFDVTGVGEFACTLSAKDLNPRSIQFPTSQDTGDVAMQTAANAEPVGLRLDFMSTFLAMMDSLFISFMQQRMEDSWADQTVAIRQAAEKRYEQARKDVEREALRQSTSPSADKSLH